MISHGSALALEEQKMLDSWVMAPLCPQIFNSPLWGALRSQASDPSLEAAVRELGGLLHVLAETDLLALDRDALVWIHRAGERVAALLQSDDAAALSASVGPLHDQVATALRIALQLYPSRLLPLKRWLAALQRAGDDGGMDPFVRGLLSIAPDSRLVRSHGRSRAALQALVSRVDELLQPSHEESPEALLDRLSGVVKNIEMAQAYVGRFISPEPRMPLDGGWRRLDAADNILDLVNRAYYGLRGHGIYGDFGTRVSHDPLQARADAASFRRHLQDRTEPMDVLEVGVGGGQFAADFLDDLARTPGGCPIRYWMGDISTSMLHDARQHVAQHGVQVETLSLDDLARSDRRFTLQRFNELFDDLTECAVLYVDAAGRTWTAEVRGTFPAAPPPLRDDGSPMPLDTLALALQQTDLATLRGLAPGELNRIKAEVRFAALDPADFPFGELLSDLLDGARDVLIPYNIGGTRFLEQCLERAEPHGLVRIYDYGLPHCRAATRYESASQVVRHFGANWTRDVLFSLLEAVAERRGWQTTLRPLGHFISHALDSPVVDFGPLVAEEGQMLTSQATLGDEALLPLSGLNQHAAIVDLAHRMDHDVSRYPEFVRALTLQGAIDLGLPPNAWPHATTLLDALGIDLAFAVGAVFRGPAREALARGQSWIADRATLDQISHRLEPIGYTAEAVQTLWWSPPASHFWVLECRAPSPGQDRHGGPPK